MAAKEPPSRKRTLSTPTGGLPLRVDWRALADAFHVPAPATRHAADAGELDALEAYGHELGISGSGPLDALISWWRRATEKRWEAAGVHVV